MKAINTLSLFSGAGGLDIGFHKAGFDILACVEIEEKYCKTLSVKGNKAKYLGSNTVIHNEDIRNFDAGIYKASNIEVVIGGPPCQTFSAAGRRSGGVIGTSDARGQLYETYCSILDKIKPKVFVFENVYGLRGANGGDPWKEIKQAFKEHGYTLHAEILDAADYGVPQHRERLIMIGTRDIAFRFPLPTHGPDSFGDNPLVSVYEAIKDLQDDKEEYHESVGGLYGHLLRNVPEGLNYSFFTAEMGHPEPVFAWRSKFHDLLYKVDRNEPCRTIKANPGKFTGPFHWKNRHFSIAELKRLQTFPDDYDIIGSYSQVVEQIGNSVPPLLAQTIAEAVREQLLDNANTLNPQSRPEGFTSTFRQRQRLKSLQFKVKAEEAIRDRYGKISLYEEPKTIRPKTLKYYVSSEHLFDRTVYPKKQTDKHNLLSCILTEAGQHLRLDCDYIDIKSDENSLLSINITGLKKYLPKFDTLSLNARITKDEDIFYYWKEIESVLTKRSKFFTLIDIYGHYANRGDVVGIETKFEYKNCNILWALIQYFSQTNSCGVFHPKEMLLSKFGISKAELYEAIANMRSLRYDIRTSKTHPILKEENVICTYPFPLLSPRALVESRAKLERV